MKKVMPTDEQVVFLLCEHIRQEQGNKLTLIGLYSGGNIIFPHADGMNLPSVSMLFIFSDGVGSFKGRFALIDPDGNAMLDHDWGEMSKTLEHKMNMIVQVSPFKAKIGEYIARADLDGYIYERRFTISVRDQG